MHDYHFAAGRTELLDIHRRPLQLPDLTDAAVGLTLSDTLLLDFSTAQRAETEAGAQTHDMNVNEFLRLSLRTGLFVSVNANQPYHFRHEGMEYDFI
jgi:hypothetical protein